MREEGTITNENTKNNCSFANSFGSTNQDLLPIGTVISVWMALMIVTRSRVMLSL